MNMTEYEKVKGMTYLEYCDYLQDKYGIGLADYMTKSFNKNKKCSRTQDGLMAHHKDEDKMIMLSTKEYAEQCPFEWQTKEHIVYCDYLEHLLLHVLICKYPSPDKIEGYDVGIGGVINFIVPELNDVYSGWVTGQPWRKTCHEKIINYKDVYMAILKDFIDFEKGNKDFDVTMLQRSFNDSFGSLGAWSKAQDKELFKEINALNDGSGRKGLFGLFK